ncbi:SOS response-associated peptidase family protein [Massilia endophytica]|uniref:SOS response-associated peptidase family protein n=1 Tax=Massilia endophytica TaxID=2899220 RepID=UPI001E50911C|nr:SOS response-associated peptidase family protein [Massilia endophytica]UGQ45067.1 SOS response-associated peptidase [Massilia endophytica]
MCYSAKVWADYRRYVKHFGAHVDIEEFVVLLNRRARGEKIVVPKSFTDAFKYGTPTNEGEKECQELVRAYDAAQIPLLQEKLFEQKRRLADAERTLATKVTKKASEDKRIATKKIQDFTRMLNDLERIEYLEKDDRIFPGNFCPVMLRGDDGELHIRPMRYLCRPAGRPAFFDTKYPGTYNARRDSLDGYWKNVFASTHAIIVATEFFENVKRHRLDGRELSPGEVEENVILKFAPEGGQVMHLACLWSHWTGSGEPDLDSFAIITDEPPPEVAAAGHDRCPIPLKPENVEAWLSAPSPTDSEALLEDKERPYYEHKLAA